MTRILGIDYGEARIGLAITDALRYTVQGLDTIEIGGDIEYGVEKIIRSY